MMSFKSQRRGHGGYTIVEVLIVFAISGALLLGALVLVKNQQGETQFQQAMQDLDSKIQSIAQDVGNSLFPNSDNYVCSLDASGRAKLTAGSGGLGTNQACLFLGRAVEVKTSTVNTLTIYTVLGARTYGNQNTAATTFDQTNPTPITSPLNLTESYKLSGGGAALKSSTINLAGDSTDRAVEVVGLYNDLEGASATKQSLLVKAYDYNSPNTGNATSCIQQVSGCKIYTNPVLWQICYQDQAKTQTAELDVSFKATGLSSQLKFTSC